MTQTYFREDPETESQGGDGVLDTRNTRLPK